MFLFQTKAGRRKFSAKQQGSAGSFGLFAAAAAQIKAALRAAKRRFSKR